MGTGQEESGVVDNYTYRKGHRRGRELKWGREDTGGNGVEQNGTFILCS